MIAFYAYTLKPRQLEVYLTKEMNKNRQRYLDVHMHSHLMLNKMSLLKFMPIFFSLRVSGLGPKIGGVWNAVAPHK